MTLLPAKRLVAIAAILGCWFWIALNSDVRAGQRYALVVGNGDYEFSPLKNPVNDAKDIAKALQRLGFSVQYETDVKRRKLRHAIREFSQKLSDGDVGLFYYSGHAIQSEGRNYLIPVGADIQKEFDLTDEAVSLRTVLGALDESRDGLNIVILDACRNNPFRSFWRSTSRGLAQVDAPEGTLVAFSTQPGNVASDGGADRNSPFTKHLLKAITIPNLAIELVFKQVRIAVKKETNGKQVPWEHTSLTSNFYFTEDKLVDKNTKKKIDKLLSRARRAFRKNQFVEPEGRNALFYYWSALELDPNNDRAKEGVREIIEYFLQQAKRESAAGNNNLSTELRNITIAIEYGDIYSLDRLENRLLALQELRVLATTEKRRLAETEAEKKRKKEAEKKRKKEAEKKRKAEADKQILQRLKAEKKRLLAEQDAMQKELKRLEAEKKALADSSKTDSENLASQQEILNLQSGLSAYYEGAYSEAYRFLAPLAAQGDPRAQVRVANMLIKARGVQRDEEEAMRLFSIALQPVQLSASDGKAWAQSDLGDYFHDGWVIDKDYRNAVYWYRRAAEQGYAPAQNILGWLYMHGHGVSPDEEIAIKWFRRAAEQGDVTALDNLKVLGKGEYVLRIVQPDSNIPSAAESKDSDVVPVPADQPSIDPELEKVKYRLTLTEENLASTELENEKLLRQIALLTEQIDKSARLIALQDVGVDSGKLVAEKKRKKEAAKKRKVPGTGFVVNKYYIVTANHLVHNCKKVAIRYADRSYHTDVVARDSTNDLVLLKLGESMLNTAKIRDGRTLRLGEEISVYGYRLLEEISTKPRITTGIVTSLMGRNNNSSFMQFSAPATLGNSGGPVLDSFGNVVGVVSAGLNKIVNVAVKSYVVEKFLSSNNVSFEKAESAQKLKFRDIVTKAERFTVLVECRE